MARRKDGGEDAGPNAGNDPSKKVKGSPEPGKERRAKPRKKSYKPAVVAKKPTGAAQKSKTAQTKSTAETIVDRIEQAASAIEAFVPAEASSILEVLSGAASSLVSSIIEAIPPVEPSGDVQKERSEEKVPLASGVGSSESKVESRPATSSPSAGEEDPLLSVTAAAADVPSASPAIPSASSVPPASKDRTAADQNRPPAKKEGGESTRDAVTSRPNPPAAPPHKEPSRVSSGAATSKETFRDGRPVVTSAPTLPAATKELFRDGRPASEATSSKSSTPPRPTAAPAQNREPNRSDSKSARPPDAARPQEPRRDPATLQNSGPRNSGAPNQAGAQTGQPMQSGTQLPKGPADNPSAAADQKGSTAPSAQQPPATMPLAATKSSASESTSAVTPTTQKPDPHGPAGSMDRGTQVASTNNSASATSPTPPVASGKGPDAAATATAMTAESFSLLTDGDVYLFNEGTHTQLYDKLGAHPVSVAGVSGTYFAVWAPNARSISVFGDFNGWNKATHQLKRRGDSGIWERFFAGVKSDSAYKYHIESQFSGYRVDKADPFAFRAEVAPQTASIVSKLDYAWKDCEWMAQRAQRNAMTAPISIYEVHLGSWRRVPEEGDRSLTYREIAEPLATYAKEMGFTHVEFMPLTEHPFYGSWGYQTTGFFAATSRYGSPQDLMYLIDTLHEHNIGVILDWVPSHFPTDEHGLSYFDGTHLFEHADPRQGFHQDWKSLIFNYGRNEVRSFLLSSAAFWLDKYHIDGLRVDAVASMLYLDYSRKPGEWVPNIFGGRENIEAVSFLRRLNEDMYTRFPGIQMIAEESTAWPMVSRPSYVGGLGFGMKWDMGWMHDTLRYMAQDPIHRRFHHNILTFRMMYAYTENFVLPLSHDEVVHGKGSLINKMPGDDWQKFANLRLLLAYMFAQPGKKLLFMGSEIAQWREWNHDRSLDWSLLNQPFHGGLRDWVRDLNHAYGAIEALHELDVKPGGFEWIDCNDSDQSVISLLRQSSSGDDTVLVVLNFTPLVRYNYQIGVPEGGYWKEILNSDSPAYGGSAQGNLGGVEANPASRHGRAFSLNLTLPPLGALFFQRADSPAEVPENAEA